MPAKKKKMKKVKRCVEMFTNEVSVVTAGANGHSSFLMIKSDSGGDVGQVVEDVEKAVPAKDADRETKLKAQQARSKKYGIEILSSGSNLTYPANTPNTERLFSDPVNLKYPTAYEGDTKPDQARTRNAIARFKQNYTAYSKNTSRARVYERIVRAALAAGIDVSYDPQDPVDKLLPGDLKTRLQNLNKSDDAEVPNAEPDGTDAAAATSDELSLDWLSDLEKSLEDGDDWLNKAAASVEGDRDTDVGNSGGEQETTEPVAKSAPPQNDNADDLEAVRKEADELKSESVKKDEEITKLKKDITKLEATMARLQTSIGPPRSHKPGERDVPRQDDDDGSSSMDLSPPLS